MTRFLMAAGTLLVAAALPLTAPAAGDLEAAERPIGGRDITVQEKDGVSYVTGGVGNDQQAALQQMEDRFNLKVTMATESGAYMGTTDVQIENTRNGEVLDLETRGPILMAELDPGTYRIGVDEAGKDATKTVSVEEGQQTQVMFRWDKGLPRRDVPERQGGALGTPGGREAPEQDEERIE